MSVWDKIEALEKKLNKAIQFWSNYGDMANLIRNDNAKRVSNLEKKVKTLDLEKKLKTDYVLKTDQLEKNDKSHQAMHDRAFKEITELQTEFADMKQAHDTWWKDLASIVTYEVPKLKEEIVELKDVYRQTEKQTEKKEIFKGFEAKPYIRKVSGGEKELDHEYDETEKLFTNSLIEEFIKDLKTLGPHCDVEKMNRTLNKWQGRLNK